MLVMFIFINNKLLFDSLAESLELNASLRAELNTCVNRERELAEANQMLRDEYQALQLAFASLEEKLRKAQV